MSAASSTNWGLSNDFQKKCPPEAGPPMAENFTKYYF